MACELSRLYDPQTIAACRANTHAFHAIDASFHAIDAIHVTRRRRQRLVAVAESVEARVSPRRRRSSCGAPSC